MFLLFLRWKEAKIKTAPARAKTPVQRLNGNELASLKQISVLIAFVQGFLNARSDEVGSSFAARLRHRLSSRERASLFLFLLPFFLSFHPFLFSFFLLFFCSPLASPFLVGRGEALLRSKQPGSRRCRRRAVERIGLSGGGVKKIRREAGEAESCLSAASSFRAAEWSVFSLRRVSLDFLILFYQEKRIYKK